MWWWGSSRGRDSGSNSTNNYIDTDTKVRATAVRIVDKVVFLFHSYWREVD